MQHTCAHKGHITESIKVIGRTGHSSDPSLGLNAIEVMHEVIEKLPSFKLFRINIQTSCLTIHYPTILLDTRWRQRQPNLWLLRASVGY